MLIEIIKGLKNQLKVQTRNAQAWKKKYLKKSIVLKNLTRKYLSQEQLDIMNGKKRVVWDNESVKKALLIKIRGGKRVLDFVRNSCVPLPTAVTLNRRIKEISFSCGILFFNIEVLKAKCESLEGNERHFGLCFDEKAIIPGQTFDPSSNSYIGKPTMKVSASVNENQLANHALVFIAMGMDPRIKEVVSFELTGSSTSGKEMKEYIFNVISEIESKAGILVDFISLDLSPCNCSFLNECGIKLTKTNRLYFISHPCDSNRKLYFKPDDVHGIKNQVSGIRKHKVELSKFLVETFNLSSSIANFTDVMKVFNSQKESAYKFAKSLTRSVVMPDHFEVMKEENASRMISSEVSQAIQLISNREDKKNATSFVLDCIGKFHDITTSTIGWTSDNPEKYQDDINYLTFMADVFYVNIKFQNAHLKSISGTIMSIRTLIDYSQYLFSVGCKIVVPSRMLSNAIENIFSLTTAKVSKPSALQFQQALRSVCISNYQREIVPGSSYSCDENSSSSVDFLTILKSSKKVLDESSINKLNYDEIALNEIINIPCDVDLSKLLSNQLEVTAFEKDMLKISLDLAPSINCITCKSLILLDDDTPTRIIMDYYGKLEYLFRKLLAENDPSCSFFRETFMFNAENFDTFNHCFEVQLLIAEKFLIKRLKLSLSSRHIHRINRFESKSLAK